MARGGQQSEAAAIFGLKLGARSKPTKLEFKDEIAPMSALAGGIAIAPTVESMESKRKALFASPDSKLLRSMQIQSKCDDVRSWIYEGRETVVMPGGFAETVKDFVDSETGFSATVHSTDPRSWKRGELRNNPYQDEDGKINMRISFYDKKEFVGFATLVLERDPQGDIECLLDNMTLRAMAEPENDMKTPDKATQDKLTGTGFGRRFHDHLETNLRKSGVKRLHTHAVGLGSRAWSSYGYEFDFREGNRGLDYETATKATRTRIIDRALAALDQGDYANEAALREQVEALRGVDFEPADFTKLGKDVQTKNQYGSNTWFGIDVLQSWRGVKYL